jgi:glucan 1,3-beta-glucosidase
VVFSFDEMSSYLETYNMMRNITGIGAGKGPYISIHDGFIGLTQWANFLPGADRFMLDTHPYFAFTPQPNDPIATGTGAGAGGPWPANACNAWASSLNARLDHVLFGAFQ